MNRIAPRRARRITYSNVVATLALIVALSGTAWAAMVTGAQIKDNSVTGRDIRNGSLTGADLKNGSVANIDMSASSGIARLLTSAMATNVVVASAAGPQAVTLTGASFVQPAGRRVMFFVEGSISTACVDGDSAGSFTGTIGTTSSSVDTGAVTTDFIADTPRFLPKVSVPTPRTITAEINPCYDIFPAAAYFGYTASAVKVVAYSV